MHTSRLITCKEMQALVMLVMAVMLPCAAMAQWRAGVIGGIDRNHYTNDKHNLTDIENKSENGWAYGVMVQYDFYGKALKRHGSLQHKIGVRAELGMTAKNRKIVSSPRTWFSISSYYYQLPIMLNYSIGWRVIRLFTNIGGYVGYGPKHDFAQYAQVNYRRFDAGLSGGVGIESKPFKGTKKFLLFKPKDIGFQIEGRVYGSMVNSTKDYCVEGQSLSHYNDTYVLQAAVFYDF